MNELPLLELFTRLREVGLPLGIDDYLDFLRALQVGFGLPDKAALARLCQTLWVKSAEDNRLFDYIFEIVMSEPMLNQGDETYLPSPLTIPAPAPPLQEITDEAVSSQISLFLSIDRDDVLFTQPFIKADKYFPATRRDIRLCLRSLRYLAREGPPVELDIEATLKQFIRQGSLFQPVMVPRLVNQIELLLLLDQDGSMVPFHTLSQSLTDEAARGGYLQRPYYFHNCPIGYLYKDQKRLKAERIQDIFHQLHPERTVALIVSDAGTARGGYNPDRVRFTERFLSRFRQYVPHIAWLNPMPYSRWAGTTAAEIASRVPMFELSVQGLSNAIRFLSRPPIRVTRGVP